MTNIRDIDRFQKAFWDWTPFNSCFVTATGKQTGIQISDIDGHIERNGHFLWIETTRKNGIISRGQQLSIERRVIRGDMAVLVFGPPNQPEGVHVYRPNNLTPTKRKPCSLQDVWTICREWFLWADDNGGAWEQAVQRREAERQVNGR